MWPRTDAGLSRHLVPQGVTSSGNDSTTLRRRPSPTPSFRYPGEIGELVGGLCPRVLEG